MTKDLFIESINAIEEYENYEGKLDELGIKLWEQNEVANLVNSFFTLLEHDCKCEMSEDDLDLSVIRQFMYDMDFGKKAERFPYEGQVIHNAGELWDFLVKKNPDIQG